MLIKEVVTFLTRFFLSFFLFFFAKNGVPQFFVFFTGVFCVYIFTNKYTQTFADFSVGLL